MPVIILRYNSATGREISNHLSTYLTLRTNAPFYRSKTVAVPNILYLFCIRGLNEKRFDSIVFSIAK